MRAFLFVLDHRLLIYLRYALHVNLQMHNWKRAMRFFLGLASKGSRAFLDTYPNAPSGIEGKTPQQLREHYLKDLLKRARVLFERRKRKQIEEERHKRGDG